MGAPDNDLLLQQLTDARAEALDIQRTEPFPTDRYDAWHRKAIAVLEAMGGINGVYPREFQALRDNGFRTAGPNDSSNELYKALIAKQLGLVDEVRAQRSPLAEAPSTTATRWDRFQTGFKNTKAGVLALAVFTVVGGLTLLLTFMTELATLVGGDGPQVAAPIDGSKVSTDPGGPMTRVPKSRADLRKDLDEQLALLRSACDQYDTGSVVHAKSIATTLRVLLHNTRQSHSLLVQLGVRDSTPFLSTSKPMSPRNMSGEFGLLVIAVGKSAAYRAPLDGAKDYETWADFETWWRGTPVLRAAAKTREDKPEERLMLTRELVVLNVADTDGGAHVDSGLDPTYADLSRGNALGLVVSENASAPRDLNDPVPPSLRQIAYEVLRTHERYRQEWSR